LRPSEPECAGRARARLTLQRNQGTIVFGCLGLLVIGGFVSIDVWFRSYLPAPTPIAAEPPPDSALIAARARQDSATLSRLQRTISLQFESQSRSWSAHRRPPRQSRSAICRVIS
jgi:hypothetical protein